MSNERVTDATLKGHHGPHFDHLEPVQDLYRERKRDMTAVIAPGFAKDWPGVPLPDPVRTAHTSDGYEWPTAIAFQFYGRHFLLVLPGNADETRRDGTYADRHAALYYAGRTLSGPRLKRVLMKAAVLFVDEYEVFFGPI